MSTLWSSQNPRSHPLYNYHTLWSEIFWRALQLLAYTESPQDSWFWHLGIGGDQCDANYCTTWTTKEVETERRKIWRTASAFCWLWKTGSQGLVFSALGVKTNAGKIIRPSKALCKTTVVLDLNFISEYLNKDF